MKKTILLAVLAIVSITFNACYNSNASSAQKEIISFYKVPLVCSADPDIGCGSRSKPALLELEKNPSVKEAWLNREGTILAIVWKNKDETETVTKPVFNENNIDFTELSEKDAVSYKENFRKENRWYRGANVDMLSREEAATIAESSVKWALENNLLTKDEAEKIKNDVQAYFKEELVKIRTSEQLSEDSQNKFREALYGIVEKHIGQDRAEKALELYEKNCEKQDRKNGTGPGAKKDCCKKN